MAVKEEHDDIDFADLINLTYLSNDLTIDEEEANSLFGTKLSSNALDSLQRAKLMKYLTAKANDQCSDVINLGRQMKLEEKLNVFETENVREQIVQLLTEYNDKLIQLVKCKDKICDYETLAVNSKISSEQRKQVELFRLEVKSKIVEIERFKRVLLHRLGNQTPKNDEALLKLKEFVEDHL
ncbi:hypothetical protein Bhyg_11018, partial [Pseudolycoriella hygida]